MIRGDLDGARMSTAIIIPTLNSGRTLGACLNSIARQTMPPGEVIVVDDVATSDNTRAIVEAFGATLIVSPGKAAESRNIGIRRSRASLLVSIDADMQLSAWLVELATELLTTTASACSVKEIGAGQGYWARARALDKAAVERTGRGRAVRAFTREAFEELGGFDVSLTAWEDWDFTLRLAAGHWRVEHLDAAWIVHDEGRLTLREAARRKREYGRTLRSFESKHGRRRVVDTWPARIRAGVALGAREAPHVVPGFLGLKLVDATAGLIGRLSPTWRRAVQRP